MQNRYTGDIGDFGKLGLLRLLQTAGLSIGVNWYLIPDETQNSDGRYVQYLEKDDFRGLDEPLRLELKEIVETRQRKVSALEQKKVLKATFFSDILDLSGKTKKDRSMIRDAWHRKAVKALVGCDIVFVDPDNGILVPSAEGTVKESKYVKTEELRDYYLQGSSVIYYQHKARRHDSFYVEQHKRILDIFDLKQLSVLGMKFNKTSQRYFFFIVQPDHQNIILETLRDMLGSGWDRCFNILQ